MRIIEQSAELIGYMMGYQESGGVGYEPFWVTNPEKLIETAGRICYKSEDRITETSHQDFIAMVCKRQHESVLEHSCASFRIITDRGILAEITRHRIASFSVESTRYCNYSKEKFGKEISVIEPPHLSVDQRKAWEGACLASEKYYFELLESGLSPQFARSVLPTCLKTELVCSANFREWKHIIALRTSSAAHPQIRAVVGQIQQKLIKLAPTVFSVKET